MPILRPVFQYRNSEKDDSPEPAAAAFLDLIISVLFIFVTMIVILALQQQVANESGGAEGRDPGRITFLETIRDQLQRDGWSDVNIDFATEAIRLPNDVLFASGLSDIRSFESLQDLRSVLEGVLLEAPLLQAVMIEGHADRQGEASKNMALSLDRAEVVYGYLMTSPLLRDAVNAEGDGLFGAAGFGETRPAVRTLDGVPNARNRRIELRFIFED